MRMMPKHPLPVTALPGAALPAAPLATLLAAAVVALAPGAALAQTDAVMRPEAIAESVLRPYSVRHARPSESAMPLPDATGPEPADNGRAPRDYSWMKGAVQVLEQPRDPVTGAYKRPKIIVGLPSDAMKSWLKSSGIEAERCLLPMVRARARVNEEGEASGALWLYARCSFQ